jgi:hypothetical protein
MADKALQRTIAKNPTGDWVYLSVDADGKLQIAGGGAGGGGTSSTDGDVFTAGASAGTPAMAEDPTSGDLLILATVPGTRALLVGGAVTGPLTDTQLRATPVPVSGTLVATPTTSNTATAPAGNTIDGTAETVLAANANRKRLILQNVGTTRIYVAFGATPTTSNYHLALPAGGSQNDGSSAPYLDTLWIGDVQVISSAAGGLLQVTEFE